MYLHWVVKIPSFPLISAETISLIYEEELIIQLFSGLFLEALTYSCFCELMKRMVDNFPSGHAMDNHLANMRSLIRVSWFYVILLQMPSFM